MKELYTKEIMSFAAHIPSIGVLKGAQGSGTAHSRLCGSRINVTLNMAGGRVSEFAQEVKACLVGQAASSIIGHQILGVCHDELALVREQVRVMLEEEGAPPDGKWGDFALLVPVRKYRSRYSTVLIAFDAVLEAMVMAQKGTDLQKSGPEKTGGSGS